MKLKDGIVTMMGVLLLQQYAYAGTQSDRLVNNKAMDQSNQYVVLPGTRLVAGNPKNNEFFLLASNSVLPARSVKPFPATDSETRQVNSTGLSTTPTKTHAQVKHKHKQLARAKHSTAMKLKMALRRSFKHKQLAQHHSKKHLAALKKKKVAHHRRHHRVKHRVM